MAAEPIRRVRFDVYGRFRVDAVRRHGTWTVYRVDNDGKRARLGDLPLRPDADLDDVADALEAAYHEHGAPGASLRVIDVLVG